jgi:hypothetical protein
MLNDEQEDHSRVRGCNEEGGMEEIWGGRMGNLQDYRERKHRNLNATEKQAVRIEIERGRGDVYSLAKKFNCVPTQIARIKARMKL